MERHQLSKELVVFAKVHVTACIRGRQDREDLTQDILRKYLELADEFVSLMPNDEFILLAKRSARNIVIDFVRAAKRRRERTVPFYARERSARSPFEQVHARLLIEEIKDRLDSVGAFSVKTSQFNDQLKRIRESLAV